MKEINPLRSDCSTGMDKIPVKYVKSIADYLVGPLTHIINVSITTSQFPRIWEQYAGVVDCHLLPYKEPTVIGETCSSVPLPSGKKLNK